jgi:hypothetical protein
LLGRPSQPRMRNRLYAEMPARYRPNTDVLLQRRYSMATTPLIRAAANWDQSRSAGSRRLRGSANVRRNRVLPPGLVVQDAVRSSVRNKTPPRGRGQAQTLVSSLSFFLSLRISSACAVSPIPFPRRRD